MTMRMIINPFAGCSASSLPPSSTNRRWSWSWWWRSTDAARSGLPGSRRSPWRATPGPCPCPPSPRPSCCPSPARPACPPPGDDHDIISLSVMKHHHSPSLMVYLMTSCCRLASHLHTLHTRTWTWNNPEKDILKDKRIFYLMMM